VDRMARFRALGWGLTKLDGQDSDILQTIFVDNLRRETCEQSLSVNVISKQLCAGSLYGDTCSGDSGGPLINPVDRYGRQAQFGIVSFGGRTCSGIGVYTDVTSYADWIEATIKKYDTPDDDTIALQPQKWLYKDCGGSTIASNLLADIYGPNFVALGVMITDR